MFWIGISGPIGSGKSALARRLRRLLAQSGVRVKRIPLARAVRRVAALEACDVDRRVGELCALFESWGYPEPQAQAASAATDAAFRAYPSRPGRKNRRLLQTIGIEVGREILGADVWIRQVRLAGQSFDVVLSDDVRFDNDADAVNLHIGIDVTAHPEIYQANLAKVAAGNHLYGIPGHSSERSLTRRPEIVVPVGFVDSDLAPVMQRLHHAGLLPMAQGCGLSACEASESLQEKVGDMTNGKEVATLAGGCFWCLEAVFDQLRGVGDVVSGYAGGAQPNPTYRQVCTGTTGHAEVVQITFDPSEVSFRELLEVFFTIHDPTTLNRQGADVGTQYRSAIFYHTPEQKAVAEQVIADLSTAKVWDNPIVTEVTPLHAFYPAEDYHQEYFEHNGEQPYCRAVVAPKVAKFRKQYLDRLKK